MDTDLRSQLRALDKSLPSLPPEQAALLERASRELAESGIKERVLKAGGQAPDFTLPNAVGRPVNLQSFLDKGPVVVTFYRGIW